MSDQLKPAEEVFPVEDAGERDAIAHFDFNRVGLLLHIMEKQSLVAPKATSIFGIAQTALNEMNEEAKDIARSRADKIKASDDVRRKVDASLGADRFDDSKDPNVRRDADLNPTIAGRRV